MITAQTPDRGWSRISVSLATTYISVPIAAPDPGLGLFCVFRGVIPLGFELNEEAFITPADAVRYFTYAGTTVSREMVYQWISRYALPVRDRGGPRGAKRYRLGDLLEAELTARLNDTGRGRARNLAA